MKNETTKHMLFLLSSPLELKNNIAIVDETLEYMSDYFFQSDLIKIDVEKVLWHYLTNHFGRTPFEDFDPAFYQNAYTKENDVYEHVKYILAYITGRDTSHFNPAISHPDLKVLTLENKTIII